MDCANPPQLSEDQLTAVIDGEAEPAVLAHLAACASCRGRLQAARQSEQLLRRRLYRFDCPGPEALGEYQLALLSQAEAAPITAHLAGCVRCREELAELQLLLGVTPDPPPAPRPAGGWLRAIVAQLLPQAAAPALRGPGRETGATYGLPDSEAVIALQWQRGAGAAITLTGQVADAAYERWTGALVELRRGETLLASAAIDDLGAFSFAGLPAGEFELRIVPPAGGLVLVPAVTVR